MTETTVDAQVREIIAEHLCLPLETLTDAPLGEQGADSLDVIELGMALEDHFDFSIADQDLQAAKTIGDFVAIVRAKTGARS